MMVAAPISDLETPLAQVGSGGRPKTYHRPMRNRPSLGAPKLYSAFAVILPVCLGLGLVYLTINGRIEAGVAVLCSLALAAVMGCFVYLRDFNDDARHSRR